MKEYKQKFFWRNVFYSKISLIILILLVLLMMKKVFNIYLKYQSTNISLAKLTKEEFSLANKQKLVQEKLLNIDSSRGQEEYLRELYALKKPGEEMIILYNSSPATYPIPKEPNLWEEVMNRIKLWYNQVASFK